MNQSDFFRSVQANIASHGYHVTVVTGGALPRYAYTIGCQTALGAEFILAGGEYYSLAQVEEIIAAARSHAQTAPDGHNVPVGIGALGTFSLVEAHPSWRAHLLLGAVAYAAQPDFAVWQIVPGAAHRTLDVPDMAQAFDVTAQPIWQWLTREWAYPVPAQSMAVTELQVLMGAPATEAVRWEVDEWEIFAGAGPDVPPEERRMVPLGVLLGIDPTLEPVVHLSLSKGLWRDAMELEWNEWE